MEVFPIASLQLVFDVLARDNASGTFRNVGNAAERAGTQADGFGGKLGGATRGLEGMVGSLKAAGAAFAGAALVGGLFSLVDAATESARVAARTENVIRTTGGAAKVTAQQVGDLAGAIAAKTGVDDEAIQSGENLLLTFTNIKNEAGDGNDIFDQTSQIMVDMSAAMGTDAAGAAIQLGKALNDPTTGMAALRKAGVSFTEAQKDQIRTLQASGDLMGAQKIILGELSKEFGGAAEAIATPMDKAKVAIGNVAEQLGSYLLPAVGAGADGLTALAEGFQGGADDADGFLGVMQNVGGILHGAFDVLGDVAHIVGDIADFFAGLPGPVQLAVGAFAAFTALKGPLSDLFETIQIKALYAAESIGTAAAGGLRGAAGGLVGLLGGPWGIAIAGATAGLGFLVSWLSKSSDAGNDMAASQQSIVDALKASNGAIDDNVRRVAAQEVLNNGLADAAERWGISLSTVTDAVLGQPDAMDQVTAAAGGYKNALDNLDGSYGNVGDSIGTAKTESDQYLTTLQGLATGTSEGITHAQDLAAAMGTTSTATGGATETTAQYTQGLQDAVDAAKDAQDQTNLLKSALDALTGANVSVDEATSAYYSALDQAKESLGDLSGEIVANNGFLNLQSEAGREVADRLTGLADNSHGYLAALVAQGASQDDVAAKDRELRDSFYQTALQLTGNDEAARNLTDRYYGIPNDIATTITADTTPAEDAIDRLFFKYGGRSIILDTSHGNRNTTGVSAATGGYIAGPGTATSDSIPAWLSNGEYVVKAASVSKYGTDFMDALNHGQIAQFANGGLAGGINVTVQADTTQLERDLIAAQGNPGGGSVGGGAWGSIWQYVHSRIPQARINSTYRAGDPGYHGKNKAIDFGFGAGAGGNGSAGLASINRLLFDSVGGTLAELIYDGLGDDRPDLKNGRPHTYDAGTRSEHHNHVHAAVYGDGTNYVPADGPAYLHRGEAVVPAALNQGAPYQSPGEAVFHLYDSSGALMGTMRGVAEDAAIGAMTAQAHRVAY